jgi:hypothetical protein
MLKQVYIIYFLNSRDLWYNNENASLLIVKIIFILFYIVQQPKYSKEGEQK